MFAQETPVIIKKTEYPIILGNKTVLTIQSGIGVFTPKERASTIQKRVEKLAKDPTYKPEILSIVEDENDTEILAGDEVIVSFNLQDAKNSNKTKLELATENLTKIKEGIEEYRKSFNIKIILLGILYSILTTIVFLFIIGLLNRFINLLHRFIDKLEDKNHLKPIKFQKLEVLSSRKIEALLKLILIITQVSAIASLLYLYISLVLSFFPWTTSQSGQLFKNIHIIATIIFTTIALYLPNLVIILIIIVGALFAMKLLKFFFNEIKRGTISFNWFFKEWSDTTYNLCKLLIVCFSIALIYPYLPGANTNAFKGVSIIMGIIFSLGSTTAISNVVAGIILTYTMAFEVGERVQINGCTGDVYEKNMFVTRIKTIKNELISIPNSKVLSAEIMNYTDLAKSHGLILNTEITIGYDVPWEKVHAELIQAALITEGIIKEKEPFVFQKKLNDFYVCYELNAYTDRPDIMAKIYSEMHQNIQNKFNEANIEIMSPHYKGIRDGNQTTIPNQYLPEDYSAPGFNIKIDKGV